jgi:hypothetical protein
VADIEPSERYQDVTSLRWRDIKKFVTNAKHHVLVILDCCYAGGSLTSRGRGLNDAVQAPTPGVSYAKESLSAACWGSTTADRMSPALCKALDQWTVGVLSVEELHWNMTDILEREGQKKEQEVRKKLSKFEKRKEDLREKKAAFQKNQKEWRAKKKDLDDKKGAKEAERKEAAKKVAQFRFNEATPAKTTQMRHDLSVLKDEEEKLAAELRRLDKEKKEHAEQEKKLKEDDEKLRTERLSLDEDEAILEEEIGNLSQPLYVRFHKTGDDTMERIQLRILG